MNIVFEGGGFPAFWYGLGYGMELLEHERPAFLAGYSAGALVATLLTCSNVDIDTVVQLYGSMPLGTRFGGMADFVTAMMEKALPPDAHVYASGYLGIILCEPDNNSKCKMVSRWDSRDELIRCLVASCYIPCFTGCTRLSDETYRCRDAVFSSDLSTFLENFNEVVRRSNAEHLGIARLCENLAVVSQDHVWRLLETGAKECRTNKAFKTHEKRGLSDDCV